MKIYMVSLFHRATINKGSISKYGIPKIKKLVPCGTDGRLLLSGFKVVVTFTLTLYRVIQHTAYRCASVIDRYLHIKFHWNRKKTFCGHVSNDGRTFPLSCH